VYESVSIRATGVRKAPTVGNEERKIMATVTVGHFNLPAGQKRFKDTLNQYPRLVPYWDFTRREFDAEALDNSIGVFSHSERLMAQFFMAICIGHSNHSFDLVDFVDAVHTLNHQDRLIISDWILNPYFP
jgi:hypothetical protein